MRMRKSRIIISGRGISRPKYGGTTPGRLLLGSVSVFFIAEDGYVVTNFHIVERAYNMTL